VVLAFLLCRHVWELKESHRALDPIFVRLEDGEEADMGALMFVPDSLATGERRVPVVGTEGRHNGSS
jgi:hypothetical protein